MDMISTYYFQIYRITVCRILTAKGLINKGLPDFLGFVGIMFNQTAVANAMTDASPFT